MYFRVTKDLIERKLTVGLEEAWWQTPVSSYLEDRQETETQSVKTSTIKAELM